MNLIMDILSGIYNLLRRLAEWAVNTFLDLNIFEKINLAICIPALFAVSMPVGRYYIFESYFYINNPLAVYMIGIVILMFAVRYLSPVPRLAAREFINAYYIFWLVFRHLSGDISKAPYTLTSGFYINIAVPAVFMLVSLLSFLMFREE